MNLKRLVRASIVIGAVFSLTACGFIQKEISSEDMMLDKAEFATGISAKNLQMLKALSKVLLMRFSTSWGGVRNLDLMILS